MIIKQEGNFKSGYNPITSIHDNYSTSMDFGILKLLGGQEIVNSEDKERAFLLMSGEVSFMSGSIKASAGRASLFDQNPICLHVPAGETVKIVSLSENSEIAVTQTHNERIFPARLYSQEDCRVEEFGKGTLGGTSTRIVRTVFDYSNADYSNLVVGEVINFPGKWSSYPPHYHPQPEIYHYRFYPEQGFGYSEHGDEVYKTRNNDTAIFTGGVTHSQAAAPGYAMYYIWVIRHLENNPFTERIFIPEHKWLLDKNAKIWNRKDEKEGFYAYGKNDYGAGTGKISG